MKGNTCWNFLLPYEKHARLIDWLIDWLEKINERIFLKHFDWGLDASHAYDEKNNSRLGNVATCLASPVWYEDLPTATFLIRLAQLSVRAGQTFGLCCLLFSVTIPCRRTPTKIPTDSPPLNHETDEHSRRNAVPTSGRRFSITHTSKHTTYQRIIVYPFPLDAIFFL